MLNFSEAGHRVEPGQIWELGRHRLLVGDALKTNHYPAEGVDLVLTDPPFEMPAREQIAACKRAANAWIVAGCGPQYAKLVCLSGVRFWWEVVCLRNAPHSLEGWAGPHSLHWGNAFLTTGGEHLFDRSLATGRFRSGNYFPSVIGPYKSAGGGEHAKPLGWALDLLACCHARTVADPFAGSGTVLIACEKLGKTCYATEIDPERCRLILARWEHATRGKAKPL
ncbi:DNA methyltransferase [Gloeobacter morelensis]|uniref:DNA methyltransferase n=1 Tax=Gloeobacter morelensis TaxID=2907343 RepID=UPI001E516E59|nr:DNA methyltransferase [Gloeobacter morelensis]UFP97270.1 hypothetical protein ISF26_24420 [Gloeobacter morelensis MG652769]